MPSPFEPPYPSPPNQHPPPSDPFGALDERFGARANPYAPPRAPDAEYVAPEAKRGSYGLGFAVGLIFALLGLLVVYFTGGEETKRGALHGLLTRFGLVALVIVVTALFE